MGAGSRNVHVSRGPSKGSTPPTTGLPEALNQESLDLGQGRLEFVKCISELRPPSPGEGTRRLGLHLHPPGKGGGVERCPSSAKNEKREGAVSALPRRGVSR